MKTKEQRKEELRVILGTCSFALTEEQRKERLKDPKFFMHIVSDCKYDDRFKNRRRMRMIRNNFKKRHKKGVKNDSYNSNEN
jgi:hypothetical protein